MARLTSDLVLTLHDKVSGPARGVDSALDRLDRKQRTVGETMRSSGRLTSDALIGMSRAAVVLAPAAIAAGAAKAFTRFAEVERSINRIGVTAGASAEQTRAAFAVVDKAAFDYATSQDEVVSGLDSMVASGRSMESALSFLPAVAATAQASGSAITDIATTADALGNSFGITGDKMQGAFDILVKAGKEGKFELKDMAAYIPTLGPAFEALGYKGESGVRKLAAALQIVRQRTGSAGEAATAFQNVLQKMETEETAKKFKSFGIDLRKEMKSARAEGKDLLEVFIGLSEKALKGDMSKLPQLFGDAQVISGMRALIAGGDDMTAMFSRLGDAAGETRKDLSRIVGDSQAKIDRLSASWDTLVKNVGSGVATFANPALDSINTRFSDNAAIGQGYKAIEASGRSVNDTRSDFEERYRREKPEVNDMTYQLLHPEEVSKAFEKAVQMIGEGSIKSVEEYFGGGRFKDVGGSQRFPSAADGQAASDAYKARHGGTMDDLPVTKGGTPAPRYRDEVPAQDAGMSDRDQRREYDAGRRAGVRAMRDAPSSRTLDINQDPGSLMPSADYLAWKQRKQAAAAAVTATDLIAPRSPMTSPREAESASMSAFISQFAALLDRAGSFAKGTTGADVRDEAGVSVDTAAMDAARLKATETGAAITTALAVTGTPTVNTGSIVAARREVDALAASLRSIPGLASSAARASSNYASEGVLNADVER